MPTLHQTLDLENLDAFSDRARADTVLAGNLTFSRQSVTDVDFTGENARLQIFRLRRPVACQIPSQIDLQGALLAALNAGRPGRLALDVFDEEPFTRPDDPVINKFQGSMVAEDYPEAWREQGMTELKTKKDLGVEANTRPDLDGEEYRDGAFYKPISIREYFKLLGYCLLGLIVVGMLVSFLFGFLA